MQKTPTPEELQAMEVEGANEVLKKLQLNRKSAQQNLERVVDNLEQTLLQVREGLGTGTPLMLVKDDNNKVVFSLEDTLRNVQAGLSNCLISVEALNSLTDMIINDLSGTIVNLQNTQGAMMIANLHVQTLLELLKEKNVVAESELKRTWERIVKEQRLQTKASE